MTDLRPKTAIFIAGGTLYVIEPPDQVRSSMLECNLDDVLDLTALYGSEDDPMLSPITLARAGIIYICPYVRPSQ